MDRKILEQEHKATGIKVFLASMDDIHIKHLIKLARDPILVNLMGWNTFFESDDTEQFIQAISSYTLPYSRKSQPLIFGVYLNPEDFPIGYAVLKGINIDLSTTEIGVAILDKKYRNKGYGKLGFKRLINYTFNQLHIQTIGAAVLLSNKFSINMCRNLGFVEREIMYKSWEMPNKELVDLAWMELTSISKQVT
ncbi:MAG: GNAT family N-acetyltransferase [Symploca sp. SIO3C6]|uniref:GNAT family N-acetyltransferase n=1 Tax=Symploca sp. SIO1C4 TaxID=2607765 RepID=A0A6B3NHQ1_9CYAN|nr:GNAT family N-acetyltransferase [Symploca sp. SIO3C6]NER30072.1 GNAT family N-acetyltransferase [Symploca sp. SIO1C4]